jgi:hypothetical protein
MRRVDELTRAAWERYYEKIHELRSKDLPDFWRSYGEILLWDELVAELALIGRTP